jgi:NADH-quinone oxidoreductase subunit C
MGNSEQMKLLVDTLTKDYGENVSVHETTGQIFLDVTKDEMLKVLQNLKEKDGYYFDLLVDETSTEYPENFVIAYHLMSIKNNTRVSVRVTIGKDTLIVPTVEHIWKSANVMEREIYDLMGIKFEGHSDLKRILLPDDFEGHPLRKDYKLEARG